MTCCTVRFVTRPAPFPPRARPLLVALLPLLLAGAAPARARPRLDGPAIVVGFHLVPPGPAEGLALPRAPDELARQGADAGLYDAWLFVFTRAPLVGAWTLNVGLAYDGRPERGVDIEEWEPLSDAVTPRPEWPAAGNGRGANFAWDRARCWDAANRLMRGRDGWWVQAACRLRVRVYSPDSLALADPEPDVRPAEVECYDEGHDLDGTDNWTAVLPAVFGAPGVGAATGPAGLFDPRPGPGPAPTTPARGVTWSQLKRGGGGR